MISVTRVILVGGTPAQKVFDASGQTNIAMVSNSAGLFIGGNNTVTPTNGFPLGSERLLSFRLGNNDEIWAIAIVNAILTIIAD